MRNLERAAAAGDSEAAFQIVRRLVARGMTIDVRLLVQAGPRAVRLLPAKLKIALIKSLMVEADVKNLDPVPAAVGGRSGALSSGWFPDHHLQNVCPRGHGIGGNNPFIFRNVGAVTEWVYIYRADAHELHAEGDSWDTEHMDPGGAGVVLCTQCNAAWPAGHVEG
jgi:hypothetical protein